MVQFRSFNFDLTEVTAMVVDTTGTNFKWVAFKKDSTQTCRLKKVDAFDLSQLFTQISLNVDEVVRLQQNTSFIFGAVNDDVNMGFRISKTSPSTTLINFAIPGGVNESPVDVALDGSNLFFLIPGNTSGEFAKVVKTNTSGVVSEIITLDQSAGQIKDAVSITPDGVGNLWIVSNGNFPSDLIRLYTDSLGDYLYEVFPIII